MQVQISEAAADAEERKQLQEPLDQTIVKSADLNISEPDDEWRTKDFDSTLVESTISL